MDWMRGMRKLAVVGCATALTVAGFAQPSSASDNVGWLYTINGGGAIFFDADLNGYPYVEKITVCDNKSDGRGVTGEVVSFDGSFTLSLSDPSNDGHCEATSGDFFTEEEPVSVKVYEYAGSWTSTVVAAWGVA